VLVVSGIWPPDVGGPASHAPDVARWMYAGGHAVEVVTTAVAPPAREAFPVLWASRRIPKGVLHLRTAALIRSRAARADVVYTTGMFGRSAAGALAARRPFVVKLTADPAFERARRRGVVAGHVDEFQAGGGGVQSRALRLARDAELRRAAPGSATSPSPGVCRPSACRCSRMRRRRCPSCRRGPSSSVAWASTARRWPSPAA
jgi:hypothetical protein